MVRDHLSTVYRHNHEWILGDSGYPLEPWLLVPFPSNTAVVAETTFNTKHSEARSIVERAIGVLKGRWRCLCSERRLHYIPITCSRIVSVCAALHNICIEYNDELPDNEMQVDVGDNVIYNFGANRALHTVGQGNRVEVMNYIATHLDE